ncbi:unnamed protein product [Diabrotica balteata]|uniref:CUB domain-containing protein n=1 Tax=Diabrotica balteata TaxID=107213 RepID=A0A9N9T794_DIABA|nr:unnamed protein product [Diabrotica balteata]
MISKPLPVKLNTKKLGISTTTQLRLTREKFGTVMVAKGHSELAGWSETNVLKSGVTLKDFKIIDLQKTRTHFGIPEKKRTDIEKMLHYLLDDAKNIEMVLLFVLIWPLIVSTVNGGWFDGFFRKREIEQEVSNALEDNRNARFMATCGQTIRENGTYFVNNEYPNQYDGTGFCQLTLIKSSPDVCQFRLNFEELNLMQPESVNHICDNDQFLVSGGNPVPVICGNSMGNHMYVSTPPGIISPLTLSVVTSGPSYQRNWKIRVLQIPCSAPYKAGEGCLQYFTGVAGQILSYNYDPETGAQLSNQDYSICIRPEWNFCGIQYTQCPNADPASPRNLSFTLSGNSNNRVPSMVGSTGTSNFCQSDYLIIPVASNVGRATANPTATVDRICGGVLAADISSTPTTVRSTVKPFQLYFHADGMEAPNDVDNKGFCLNYIQVPCASAFT